VFSLTFLSFHLANVSNASSPPGQSGSLFSTSSSIHLFVTKLVKLDIVKMSRTILMPIGTNGPRGKAAVRYLQPQSGEAPSGERLWGKGRHWCNLS